MAKKHRYPKRPMHISVEELAAIKKLLAPKRRRNRKPRVVEQPQDVRGETRPQPGYMETTSSAMQSNPYESRFNPMVAWSDKLDSAINQFQNQKRLEYAPSDNPRIDTSLFVTKDDPGVSLLVDGLEDVRMRTIRLENDRRDIREMPEEPFMEEFYDNPMMHSEQNVRDDADDLLSPISYRTVGERTIMENPIHQVNSPRSRLFQDRFTAEDADNEPDDEPEEQPNTTISPDTQTELRQIKLTLTGARGLVSKITTDQLKDEYRRACELTNTTPDQRVLNLNGSSSNRSQIRNKTIALIDDWEQKNLLLRPKITNFFLPRTQDGFV
jgi:hypothetical protein